MFSQHVDLPDNETLMHELDHLMCFGTDVPTKDGGLAPSLDPWVSQLDRWIVFNLPPEGKRQFSENIHQYIGQLDREYRQPSEGDLERGTHDH